MGNVALFDFAYHGQDWLAKIADVAKGEPWGKDLKVLELVLRANFEIAKQQNRVYENPEKGVAFWKPGYMVSKAADQLWLIYEKNKEGRKQKWAFKHVCVGYNPIQEPLNAADYQIKYEPKEFNPAWDIFIDQKHLSHILSENKPRLESVFGKEMAKNSHLLFRAIYGEIMLEKKEATTIIPQWYSNEYQFLMPLYLTQSEKVELTAALTIDNIMQRYQLRTLLHPTYAYAYARAVVKSRAQFGAWLTLDDTTLNNVDITDDV